MAGLSLSGLASGIDTASIVEQLMAVERAKRDRMDLRQSEIGARQSGLGSIQGKLATLRNAAAGLRDVGTWADQQAVESSDATRVAATRLSGAGPGGYAVSVLALARAEQQTFTYTPPASATTISFGSKSVALAAGATVDDAVSAVNGSADSPVYAANVNGKLVLSARTAGTTSAFTATSSSLAQDSVRLGQDAQYTIDGGPVRTATSNVVTDAVAGVQLTFKGVTATDVSVTVGSPALDKEAVKTKVKAFVEAYNAVVTTTRGLLETKRVAGAETSAEAAQGVLWGDSGLSTMLSRLRTAASNPVTGNAAAMDELRELGVSTGAPTGGASTADAKTGLLVLDEKALDKALASPQDVRKMLGGIGGTDGFAQRVENLVKTYTGTGGTLTSRVKEGDNALKSLQDAMAAEDQRLSVRETRLKAQFSAMEKALSAAQTQQSWLAGQLASLAG